MHELLVKEIVKVCRQRLADGDCPTVRSPTVGNLEDAIIALAADIDAAAKRSAPHATKVMQNLVAIASAHRGGSDHSREIYVLADDAMMAVSQLKKSIGITDVG